MTDVIIRASNLAKVYRLYTKPVHRFLDMFGLLKTSQGAYTEHAALGGVNLEIRRGEKVAFIGRNGAGKSTLLKLLTGVIEPTRGTLSVQGQAHALLQIGSGFHPDFTGRQNVIAYLAQLGVVGSEAARKCEEIIEFAELEEYIDQPVKTYSSGMGVRLMFATSTAITPDLLVLDEVLGVGDAYFAGKSYSRIRDLCAREGTTLLLVTHDVYSAVSICERVIWIDRGRILMDGDGATVVNAYEDSIRVQEENRLRLRAESRARELRESNTTPAMVEILSADRGPQPSPVYFSSIDVYLDDDLIGKLPIAEASTGRTSLQAEGTNWGDAGEWQQRTARPMLNFGSPFHKVAGSVALDSDEAARARRSLRVSMDYWSAEPCALEARAFVNGQEIHLGALPPSNGNWVNHIATPVGATNAGELRQGTSAGRQGTGAIVIDALTPRDGNGRECYTFRHGAPFELTMRYRINQPDLSERPQVLVAFHRDGTQDVMRTICRDFSFEASQRREGTLRVAFPKLPLANGTYAVTVMVARERYYDEEQTLYFSINPGVYT
ncbi:MAG TPA: ABC transporter ATP-binding protein, partial [Vicinamibacterales bacterium]|nr:ABC transporter ATP-binding protein [Vicinamibacterales bacterium]